MQYTQVKISIQPIIEGREVICYFFSDLDFDYFQDEEDGTSAYIISSKFEQRKIDEVFSNIKNDFQFSYEIIKHPDINWNAEWESNFHPIEVDGKCFIRAPFHEANPDLLNIIILPQMSFGTGHHETTWLMSKKIFDLNVKNKSVLDMGCGTGILAILVSKLEASNVLAIDIEDWSYHNTIENMELNKAINITVEKGGAELLASRLFSLILANINLNVLLADMKYYFNSLENGGEILFSGVFTSDLPVLKAAAENVGLTFKAKEEKNNWMVAHFTK